MDGEVVTEQLTEPKTHLALDMDWITLALGAICFAFCLLTMGAMARRVLIGAPIQVRITWETVFLFLAFTWLALRSRERLMKFGSGLLGTVFGSRFILAVFHASAQIQVMNGQIMRVVELVVMAGFCFYFAHWFKERIGRT